MFDHLLMAVRGLPFVNAPELDGEESDGTPRHYRSRRYVSLTKLERLLREQLPCHTWQPIETCPEDEHVLLALRLGHHSIGWWTDEGDGRKWFHQGKTHESLTPLAWMSLPMHPEEETSEWEHPCQFRGEPTLTPEGKACSACGLREEDLG